MADPREKSRTNVERDPVAEELERLKKEAAGSSLALPFNPAAESRMGKLIAQSVSKVLKLKQRHRSALWARRLTRR